MLNGGARALVRISPQEVAMPEINQLNRCDDEKPAGIKKSGKRKVIIDASCVRTVNELARQEFKHRILNDILFDLMVCEIEGWSKLEYINEIRCLINSIGRQDCIDV